MLCCALVQAKDSSALNSKHGCVQGLAKALGTDTKAGLPADSSSGSGEPSAVEASRAAFGANKYKQVPPKSFFKILFEGFRDPVILLLCAAATVSGDESATSGPPPWHTARCCVNCCFVGRKLLQAPLLLLLVKCCCFSGGSNVRVCGVPGWQQTERVAVSTRRCMGVPGAVPAAGGRSTRMIRTALVA
jgi:hypothetical protein